LGKPDTHSLAVALQLSEVCGADLETETVRVNVSFLESWRVCVVEVCAICETVEACTSFLQAKGYPVSDGWLPEPPLHLE
jgi:hypothetical protein